MTRTLQEVLNTPLLELAHEGVSSPEGKLISRGAKAELWRLRDAVEGTQIFGATGSGKTSGSGATFARAFLDRHRGNMGGLVLTAKADAIDDWKAYLRETGRSEDLVEVKPGGPYSFNFLRFEASRTKKTSGVEPLTYNLVSLLLTALSTGDAAVSKSDPYWNDALRELLTHTIDLQVLAGEDVDLARLIDIVRSAPQSHEETLSKSWQGSSVCYELLVTGGKRWKKSTKPQHEDFRQTANYWLNDFPALNNRTRSIVVSSFTSKLAGLLRSPIRELLCSPTPSAECEPAASHIGKVIVLNIPTKAYGEVGRIAQVLFKTLWQRATENREVTGDDWRPVFLWADEAQYFVSSEDMLFQQTARSKVAATVYLTQNLPNYYASFGQIGQAAAESLVGNLQTKVFHANGDPTTNDWAQRLFGQQMKRVHTTTTHKSDVSTSTTASLLPVVESPRFTTLAKGGEHASRRVSAIIFQGGRTWPSNPDVDRPGHGHNYIEHAFTQG